MWIFLATEVMFFGGLFAGYTIYRNLYLPGFEAGSHMLNVTIGAINTARADWQQLDHGPGGARRANGKTECPRDVPDPHDLAGTGLRRHQADL